MSFNMVANQSISTQKKDVLLSLSKIRMDSERQTIENLADWDESLTTTFATFGLSQFLNRMYGIQAPQEQVGRLLVQQDMKRTETQIRKRYQDQIKSEILTPKKERKPKRSGKNSEPSAQDHGGSGDEEFESLTPAQQLGGMCEVMRENAADILEIGQKAQLAAEQQGRRRETLFLRAMTRVRPSQRALNPQATVPVQLDWDPRGPNTTFYYEVEDTDTRAMRMLAWDAIKKSLGDLPKTVWKHIAIGNVYELYSLIGTNYMNSGRDQAVGKLTERLADLRKLKSENFVQFVARYDQIILGMKELGLKVDSDDLVSKMQKTLLESECQLTQQVYANWLLSNPEGMKDPKRTFESMKASMRVGEQRAARKKREQKSLEKAEKEKRAEIALKVSEGIERESRRARKGVCLAFQSGKCNRGKKCNFLHEKLSASEVEDLKIAIEKSTSRKSGSDDDAPGSPKPGSKVKAKLTRNQLALSKDDLQALVDMVCSQVNSKTQSEKAENSE